MPIIATCPRHPDASVDYPDQVREHALADHPGEHVEAVYKSIIRRTISQAHAHGRPNRHVIHCRRCNTPIPVDVMPGDRTDNLPTLCEGCG